MFYLRYVCIVVSNTYCVVFLFCFSSSLVPYVGSFSALSIVFITSSVFSNVYFSWQETILHGVWLFAVHCKYLQLHIQNSKIRNRISRYYGPSYIRFAWRTLFQHLGQSPVCLCLFILFSYFIFVYLLLCLHS
jgi:hypothetical protein